MSILIDKDTRVVIMGITGRYGRIQTETMLKYGTQVVAGVSPGKAEGEVFGVPIYDTVAEAIKENQANAGIVYLPPFLVRDAVIELIENGIKLIMIPTEGLPVQDTMYLKDMAKENDVWILGPNTIGMISPGKCLLGSLASDYALEGSVGVLSRGGTIVIETLRMLSAEGIGQSTAVGSGGDQVLGRNAVEYLELFEKDPQTKVVVLLGEIGGLKENECAELIKNMSKKVIFYLLGRTAPKGAKMGHAGTIVGGAGEGFHEKREALREAGAIVVDTPWEMIARVKEELDKL